MLLLFHTEHQLRFPVGLAYPEALLVVTNAAACANLG